MDFAIKNIEAKASLRQNTTVVHTAEICGMFMRVSRCFEMFRDVSRCFEMFRDVSRCFEMFRDVSRC